MQRQTAQTRRQDPISCSLCRKKKLRCNRQNPCSNCIARKVPCEREGQLPVGLQPGGYPGTNDDAVTGRLQRLEELVLRMSEQLEHAGTTKSQQPTPKSLPDNVHSLPDNVATPHEEAHQADTKALVDIGTRDNSALAGLSDGLAFKIVPLRDMCKGEATKTHKDLRQGQHSRDICLPLKDEAIFLFELYVQYASYLHHIIHIPTARASVYEIYSDAPCLGGPNQNVSFGKIAFLLSMLASALSFQVAVGVDDLTPIPVSRGRATSMHFIKSTFDVLEHSRRVGFGSVEYVQAMIATFFLMYNREGFSSRARVGFGDALSVARDIGLHRTDYEPEAAQLHGMGEVEKEVRRRVWWHMTASDWVLALSGGPTEGVYNIHPSHMACQRPRNINDDQIARVPPHFSHPLSTPTDASYLIQRIRLAKVCRQVVDMIPLNPSNPNAVPYTQLLELDKYFQDLFDELPYFFKIDPESRRMAKGVHEEYPHIAIQRYMINMTANTRRCKLHQPFLLRGFTNPTYRHSRDVCLHSARLVLQMKREIANESMFAAGLANLSGINHHVFFAAIALVMDLCFNKTEHRGIDASGMTEEDRKREVWEACEMLKVSQETHMSSVAGRFFTSLTQILRKHRVGLDGITGPAIRQPWHTNDGNGSIAPGAVPASLTEQAPLLAPGDSWAFDSLPDFDAIWQGTIDQGAFFEDTDWEQLFSELEPKL